MIWLAIAVGAALGAMLRFATDRYLIAHKGPGFPYGTLVVNLAGSLILGLLTGLLLGAAGGSAGGWELVSAFLGTGFCGALTTFSGFVSQVLDMSINPSHWKGTAYALGSVIAGFALATAGYALTV
ncbi:MAG: CrcB family protein [Actinomycetes bacterium]